MLKQKAVVVAFALSLASPLVSQTSAVNQPAAAQPHVIKMVTLVANVEKSIDTRTARAGEVFEAKVANPEKLNDGTVVPAGSILEGRVDSVTPSENKGDSILTVTIDKLAIKSEKEIPIKATIIHVASVAPITEERPYSDPSVYQRQNIQASRPAPLQDPNAPKGPHAIHDLTLTSSPTNATSGTFIYAKQNLHLANTVQLQISVAVVPPGVVR
jgi:hypothetical protein